MLRTEALHPSQLEEEGQLKTTEEKMQTVGNGADEAKTLRPLGLPLKLKPQVRMTLGELWSSAAFSAASSVYPGFIVREPHLNSTINHPSKMRFCTRNRIADSDDRGP